MSIVFILEQSKTPKFQKWFVDSVNSLVDEVDSVFKKKSKLYGTTWLVKGIDGAVNNCFHKSISLYLMKQSGKLSESYKPKLREGFLDLYNNSRIAQLRLRYPEENLKVVSAKSVKDIINLGKTSEVQSWISDNLTEINSKILKLIEQRDSGAAWILGGLGGLIEMANEKVFRAISILESEAPEKDKQFGLQDSMEDLMVYSVLGLLLIKLEEDETILFGEK